MSSNVFYVANLSDLRGPFSLNEAENAYKDEPGLMIVEYVPPSDRRRPSSDVTSSAFLKIYRPEPSSPEPSSEELPQVHP